MTTQTWQRSFVTIFVSVRGQPSERLFPLLGVEEGLAGGNIVLLFLLFFIFLFAGLCLFSDNNSTAGPPAAATHP